MARLLAGHFFGVPPVTDTLNNPARTRKARIARHSGILAPSMALAFAVLQHFSALRERHWVPAFAGMTSDGGSEISYRNIAQRQGAHRPCWYTPCIC